MSGLVLESGLESQRKNQVPLGLVGVQTWVPRDTDDLFLNTLHFLKGFF